MVQGSRQGLSHLHSFLQGCSLYSGFSCEYQSHDGPWPWDMSSQIRFILKHPKQHRTFLWDRTLPNYRTVGTKNWHTSTIKLSLWIHIPSQKVIVPSKPTYINSLQSHSEKVCGSIGYISSISPKCMNTKYGGGARSTLAHSTLAGLPLCHPSLVLGCYWFLLSWMTGVYPLH